MTDDIKAIRERLEAATPGPWASDLRDTGTDVTTGNGSDYVAETDDPADAALIAHAPTDLADLCDEVEVWREVGVALGVDGPAAALAEALRLRTEVEALRAGGATTEMVPGVTYVPLAEVEKLQTERAELLNLLVTTSNKLDELRRAAPPTRKMNRQQRRAKVPRG